VFLRIVEAAVTAKDATGVERASLSMRGGNCSRGWIREGRPLFPLALILVLRSELVGATVVELPPDGSTVVGVDTRMTSHYADTLLDIARRYSRQSARAPLVLLSQTKEKRAPGSPYLSGQHRQVGPQHAAGAHPQYPEDLAVLFALVPVGTNVSLVNQPVKLAHVNGELWLEVHPQVPR
jgi:hypothetical protein